MLVLQKKSQVLFPAGSNRETTCIFVLGGNIVHVEERAPACTINNNNDMNPWSLIIDIYKYIHS